MTEKIQVYGHFHMTGKNAPKSPASVHDPVSLSVNGDSYVIETTAAVSTTIKVFDVDEDLGDFDFLYAVCDHDVMLELVVDAGAEVGTVASTVQLAGTGTTGEYGTPFMLASDTAYANYTSPFAGGTLDVIEEVRVKNLSTTQAAKVYFCAVT